MIKSCWILMTQILALRQTLSRKMMTFIVKMMMKTLIKNTRIRDLGKR